MPIDFKCWPYNRNPFKENVFINANSRMKRSKISTRARFPLQTLERKIFPPVLSF